MRCIFCKSPSDNSKSVEHIIPESLGNKEHILNAGLVCGKCNQYFALKIEKPVLESSYFTSLRHRNSIRSKKNKIPLERAFMGKDGDIFLDKDSNEYSININNPDTIQAIMSGKISSLIIPIYDMPPPNDKLISKFIGKIGLEVLAHTVCHEQSLIDEIVDKHELNLLRNYVRFNNKPAMWEYHQRRIYPEDELFSNSDKCETFEVLHEFKLLYTEKLELFVVIAIMGIEYAINLASPEITSYLEWLRVNNNISPLYLS